MFSLARCERDKPYNDPFDNKNSAVSVFSNRSLLFLMKHFLVSALTANKENIRGKPNDKQAAILGEFITAVVVASQENFGTFV